MGKNYNKKPFFVLFFHPWSELKRLCQKHFATLPSKEIQAESVNEEFLFDPNLFLFVYYTLFEYKTIRSVFDAS